ncbi:SDR family oxidoreductase [Ruania alkalisoli]|uniref:SDR family oxidoreductase n=1 Tax=Ruania alkalisoli TaxID=2779775 RepID=A0A7M1SX71_9MICO|nr:SDR family oxidoreductase [Ruania alkalisoli]QOR71544.1 SDR family oxidoreductase [Ruania alkalisoli]
MRAVVVGSSSDTAQQITDQLAANGAQVVGINKDPYDRPALTASVTADMSDPEQAVDAFSQAARILGGIDGVVTGLAFQRGGKLHQTSAERWRAVRTGTLDATFFTLQAAIPHLRQSSSVVAISSVNATVAHPGNSAYATAKGGVTTMMRQAALEYAPRGIRFNVVAPAFIERDENLPDDVAAGYPMGRIVTAAEVAAATCFLLSPAASGITGVVLPVDAGLSIASPSAFLREGMRTRWLEDD